jgi:hypothetical protein
MENEVHILFSYENQKSKHSSTSFSQVWQCIQHIWITRIVSKGCSIVSECQKWTELTHTHNRLGNVRILKIDVCEWSIITSDYTKNDGFSNRSIIVLKCDWETALFRVGILFVYGWSHCSLYLKDILYEFCIVFLHIIWRLLTWYNVRKLRNVQLFFVCLCIELFSLFLCCK